jgi:hypothetical protein
MHSNQICPIVKELSDKGIIVSCKTVSIIISGLSTILPKDIVPKNAQIYGIFATVGAGGKDVNGVNLASDEQANSMILSLYETSDVEKINIPLIHLVRSGRRGNFLKTFLKDYSDTKSKIIIGTKPTAPVSVVLTFVHT